MNIVYGLVDPHTLLVRYVGLSTNGLKRPNGHRAPSSLRCKSHKNAWIKTLFDAGLDYTIVVLEVVATKDALPAAERFWIALGRAFGWPLTNLTDGGDGGLNPAPETRAKVSAALRGRVLTPEHRAKIGAAQRGVSKDPEHVAKVAEALRGKKRTPESIANQIASRRKNGYTPSPETRAKLRASNIGKKRPPSVGIAVAESNRRRTKERLK